MKIVLNTSCNSIPRICSHSCVWFPRVSVNLLLLWGITVHLLASRQVGNYGLIPAYLGVFNAICAFVSYYNICRIGPGSPLDIPELVGDEESGVPNSMVKSIQTKHNGGYRYCSKCMCWKPDRSHHCRKCNRCILKMDHHCPWFSECIGFKNHKYFVQFLWYIAFLCISAMMLVVPIIYGFFHEQRYATEFLGFNFILYAVLASTFSLCVTGFAAFTTYEMVRNTTTLESMERSAYRVSLSPSAFRYRSVPDTWSIGNAFDMGPVANATQVLGLRWSEWILPIPATLPDNVSRDGIRFPTNGSILERAEQQAQTEIALHDRRRQWEADHRMMETS